MNRKSFTQILSRTFDYMARRHPWFDAIQRRRVMAATLLLGYGAVVFMLAWQVHGGRDDGWIELVKSYSALFFDLLVLFLLSVLFLLVRGYYLEEKTRIDTALLPDKRFFTPVQASSVRIDVDSGDFFERHPAVHAILDALPMDQSDFFLAHAGCLDIPKLALRSIARHSDGSLQLRLGVASFKEFFFTHHFADYNLSRSSSRDSGAKETLRTLFSPIFERNYRPFFEEEVDTLDTLSYTPNTMGVTGCVRVVCGEKAAYFFQRRGFHESAARGVLQLSYAGTLNAYPQYADQTTAITLESIAEDEFADEFLQAEPGRALQEHLHDIETSHELVGLCANSQYLFQPELFVLTTISVASEDIVSGLLTRFAPDRAGKFVALPSFDGLAACLAQRQLKLRPLCQVAIETIYRPRLS